MPQHTVRVWDLPTRLFHIVLLLSVGALVVTAKVGGNAMVWHFRLGYLVLALLLFRIVWGLVGGHWSRFRSFIPSPAQLIAYLRGQLPQSIGHNPLGALSVLAMLLVLLLQVGSGLCSDDEIANAGPLTAHISGAAVSLATTYHKEIGQWLLLSLVALHILAVLAHRLIKQDDLIRPMLTGDKRLEGRMPASRDDLRTRLLALALATGCLLLVLSALQLLQAA